jgi:hypothetical protein
MISADYVVGLTDGEGCFYVLIKPPFNKNGGAVVILNFHIKLQSEDKPLLDKVQKFFGCGNVYYQHEKRLNHTTCYRFTVNSHRDLLGVIIPFFKTYRLETVSKRRNFHIFANIAQLVSDGLHHTTAGLELIRELKSKMNHRTRVVR